MINEINGIYSFGRLKFDPHQRKVWIDGKINHLQPKERDLLLYFIQNSDQVLKKDDLYDHIWKDEFVEDQQLTKKISHLRKILSEGIGDLGEGIGDPIENIPREGYKFNPGFFRYKDPPCPWRGFRFYDEANEDFFCGREDDVHKIINKLQINPFFLTLIGPSGIGKTSIVRAGLIPKLKKEEISSTWKFISLRPTHQPLFELARKIASIKHPDSSLTDEIIDPIMENLRNDHKSIIQELIKITDLKLFLFIDQIEILLSKEITDSEADIFVEFLLELSENKQITQAIVLGLRIDFYDVFCKRFDKLLVLITENLFPIKELSETQLKRVIDEPAHRSGLEIEEGVSDQIVEDLLIEKSNERRDSPLGILPLLSNFLVELFSYREGNKIILRSYFFSGKVKSSISRYAEEVFQSLSNKLLAEKLLTLLVNVGENLGNDSCKPVTVNEILEQFEEKDKEEVQIIIQELIEKRLLISWNDSQNNVELPHASLIKNWDRIESLINAQRKVIKFAEFIKGKTARWLAGDKDPDELMTGSDLQTAIELHKKYVSLIGPKEEKYFNASVSAKSDRENQEIREKKRKLRYKTTIWVSILTALAFLFGFIYFIWVNNKANAAKTAAIALTELDKNPANALKQAIQAVEMDETPDTVAVLQAAITNSHLWKSLKGHTAPITAIAVSNDGKFLITSSRDNTARIWDRESGELIHTLEGHEKAVEGATFSPDGKYALTASYDETLRVWEVSSGKEIKKIKSERKGFNNVAVSPPDGKFILTAGENDTAVVWDFASGEKRFVLPHPKVEEGKDLGLNSAIFSPDGKLIATGSGDKTAIIWDALSGKPIKTLKHPDSVLNLAFSLDGKVLITAGRDGVARIWNVEDWSLQSALGGHQGQINCVAFDSTGERLVTASMDRTAVIWDWRKGKIILSLKGHTGAITSAVFSSDGRFVYTSSGDTEAGIWKIKEDFNIKPVKGHTLRVYETSFSTDGKMLLTASKDATARLWKAESGELLRTLPHTSAVRSAKFSPDTKIIATATEDGKIYFWEAETGKLIKAFLAHAEPIYSIAFNHTGESLASGGKDGAVKLWSVLSGEEIKSFEKSNQPDSEITSIAFSPDGNTLAASSKDRSVKLWDIPALTKLDPWLIGTGVITSVFFGVDDNRILVSGNDKSLRVWDRHERKQISVLLGHTEKVNYAEYSPDGKFIVSASADNTIRIWSSHLQRALYRIEVLSADFQNNLNDEKPEVLYASFSPDGKDIIYSTNYGLVQIIRCPICSINNEELISKAKERLPKV